MRILRSVAAVYTLQDVNRFRIIAYEKAADAIEQLNRELHDMWENDPSLPVSGIGPTIRKHLDEYFKKGNNSYLIEIMGQVPPAVFKLMEVPGIGVKKAHKLVTKLELENVNSVFEDVIKKAKSNQIAELDSFGEKSQEEIVKSIKMYMDSEKREKRVAYGIAARTAEDIKTYMHQNSHVIRIEALGSLRRGTSTVGDIDLAVVCEKRHAKEVLDHFVAYHGKVKLENRGPEKVSLFITGGLRVDMRIAYIENFGAMLQYFTGSKAHNIKLREYALKKGCSLSEYGIKEVKNSKKLEIFKNEEDFYRFLGLQYIPPELRSGTIEIEAARTKRIPELVAASAIKGDFHVHSSYNLEPSHDLGVDSYEELIEKAKELGYEYIAFADHNPSVSNHSTSDIVGIMRKRFEHLQLLSIKYERIHLFISCEVDILPTGQLALPDEAFDYVDFIIASVHSSFRLDRETQTSRVLKALSHPKVKIFGHPTGRLIGKREEIDVLWDKVFAYCAKKNIALEINSATPRLDLPDSLVFDAAKYGCVFAINTDAHAKQSLDTMQYGVTVARRGWLEKKSVINTWTYAKLQNFFRL